MSDSAKETSASQLNAANLEPDIRRYSFSKLLNVRGDKGLTKPDLMRVQHHLPEDCDRHSIMSDSGVSDISQATEGSVNSVVNTGIAKENVGIRKNFSTNDITNLRSHGNPLLEQNSTLNVQQRLPNIMLWNWLKHQSYGVSDKPEQSTCSASALQTKFKIR